MKSRALKNKSACCNISILFSLPHLSIFARICILEQRCAAEKQLLSQTIFFSYDWPTPNNTFVYVLTQFRARISTQLSLLVINMVYCSIEITFPVLAAGGHKYQI
jgi:hypothetical protein